LVVLVALVIVALLAGVALLARRSGGDELDSVRSYHAAVGTMERLPTRSVATTLAPRRPFDIDDPDDGADGGIGPSVPMTGYAAGAVAGGRGQVGGFLDSGRQVVRPARLMFDDASPLDPSVPLSGSGVPIRRERRMRSSALESMNRRSRPGTGVLIVVVLVLFVGALAYIGSRHSGHRPTASPTASSHPATRSAGGTPYKGAASPRGKAHRAPPPAKPTQLVALSATLLQPGGSQVINATGMTVVELGAAGASMTVGSVPVLIPRASVTPFTATFQPSTT
jgi:hypothetical protein